MTLAAETKKMQEIIRRCMRKGYKVFLCKSKNGYSFDAFDGQGVKYCRSLFHVVLEVETLEEKS